MFIPTSYEVMFISFEHVEQDTWRLWSNEKTLAEAKAEANEVICRPGIAGVRIVKCSKELVEEI